MSESKGLSNSDLESIGFKSLGHCTVGDQVKFHFSRGRYLSAMCVGQGNESVWLCHKDRDGEITDLICVHNRDYDGFITIERLNALIEWFGYRNLTVHIAYVCWCKGDKEFVI